MPQRIVSSIIEVSMMPRRCEECVVDTSYEMMSTAFSGFFVAMGALSLGTRVWIREECKVMLLAGWR